MSSKTAVLRKKWQDENPGKYEEYKLRERERSRARRAQKKAKWLAGPHTRELEQERERERLYNKWVLQFCFICNSLLVASSSNCLFSVSYVAQFALIIVFSEKSRRLYRQKKMDQSGCRETRSSLTRVATDVPKKAPKDMTPEEFRQHRNRFGF